MSYQGLVDKLDYVYRGFWREYGAKGMDHLPLLEEGPWKVLGICAVYLWFVKVIGPNMMKNREPFNIKPYMLAYNIFLVLLHLLLFPLGFWASDYFRTTWRCERLVVEPGKNTLKENIIILLGYTYFLTKFVEMLDTVFFILR